MQIKTKLIKITTNHVLINAKINNANGIFLLDTGSNSTVINKKKYKKFKLDYRKNKKNAICTGNSNIEMNVSFNNKISFKNLTSENNTISLIDFKHINDALKDSCKFQVDGIIGSDVLIKHNAKIDYQKLVLFLYN